MTLLQRANQLAESLEQLEANKQLAQEVQTFSSRAFELEQAVQTFTNLVRLAKIFRSRNVPYSININLIGLRQTLETIATCYHSDPNTIKPKPNAESSKSFWKLIKDYPAKICQSLELAWENYTQSIRPSLNEELLKLFEELPSTREQVKIIRQLQEKAKQLTAVLPKDESDIDQLRLVVSNIHTAWQGLETTETPASVLVFLKAAYGGGAALQLFTDEVRQWLEIRQLSHAFFISPRPTPTSSSFVYR